MTKITSHQSYSRELNLHLSAWTSFNKHLTNDGINFALQNQQILQLKDLQRVLEHPEWKELLIRISHNGSVQSERYANEIMTFLTNSGYNNVVNEISNLDLLFFKLGNLKIIEVSSSGDKWIHLIVIPQS